MIKEDNKSEVLKIFDYDSDELIERIRINSELAIKENKLKIKESRQLISKIENSLRESTYLSE